VYPFPQHDSKGEDDFFAKFDFLAIAEQPKNGGFISFLV
jgi:hypothetical protein